MIILKLFLIYILISIFLYIILDILYKTSSFNAFTIKNKYIYYILSATWGILPNIVAVIFIIVAVASGKDIKKYGWNFYIEFDINFGLNIGILCIVPKNASTRTKNHEHGHGIQNIYLGPFVLTTCYLPSAIRYWIRELFKDKITTDYDNAWFEGSATISGNLLIDYIENQQ